MGFYVLSVNRTRNNAFMVYLNDSEKGKLHDNMQKLGISNREAYVRKMILDGFTLRVDTKPISELVRLVRNAATNINQIAKRANESGTVYEDSVIALQSQVDSLIPLVVEARTIVNKLNKL